MARIYRSLMEVCWALGFLSVIFALVLKYDPVLAVRFNLAPRGTLVFAGVLFLAAIATRAVGRTGVPSGS
jgi:hypothetical protein